MINKNSFKLQKAIVMELLNVMKAEEGQKKMIFGRPFHYAGSKWVPDKAGPKKEVPKERSSGKKEDPNNIPGKSVRGERGHIDTIYGEEDSIKDLMNCALDAKFPITKQKAKEYYQSCLSWSNDPSDFRLIQQGKFDGSESRKKQYKDDVNKIENLFEFYPVYKDRYSKIYRGVSLDLAEGWSDFDVNNTFRKGSTVDMKGLSSWSSDHRIAEKFSEGTGIGDSISIVFESPNKKGISLKSMSSHRKENEVLHSSKTKWKVKNLVSTGKNKYKIILDEI